MPCSVVQGHSSCGLSTAWPVEPPPADSSSSAAWCWSGHGCGVWGGYLLEGEWEGGRGGRVGG